MVRQVTLICGPPCAGKSTWVAERASPGDLVVDFDAIARRLGSRSRHDHPQHVKNAVNAEVERLFELIERSDDVTGWVIRTLPVGADRAALAERLRADRVVVMRPTLAEIRRRAAADNRPAWTVQAARRWWEQFSPHPIDEAALEAAPEPQEGAMADDETPDAPEADEATEAPGGQQDDDFDRSRAEEKIRKANAEAANLRKRLKELEPLAAKAKELEDAGRSDVEKLTAELQAHQTRAGQAEAELMRLRVAMRKGLTETQARRLVGSTEEELEEDADDLLASFRPATPEPKDDDVKDSEPERDPNPRRRPQERLRPGAVPDADTEPVETDPRKLAAMVRRDVF